MLFRMLPLGQSPSSTPLPTAAIAQQLGAVVAHAAKPLLCQAKALQLSLRGPDQ